MKSTSKCMATSFFLKVYKSLVKEPYSKLEKILIFRNHGTWILTLCHMYTSFIQPYL